MSACRRDRIVEKRADLRDGRSAGNICGDNTSLDVADLLRLGLGLLPRSIAAQNSKSQNYYAERLFVGRATDEGPSLAGRRVSGRGGLLWKLPGATADVSFSTARRDRNRSQSHNFLSCCHLLSPLLVSPRMMQRGERPSANHQSE
jgi:hypothetical protein